MKTPMTTSAPTSAPAAHKTFWAWTVATFFGAGFGRPGPGTWGSVAALLLWAAYAWGISSASGALLVALFAAIALALVFGIPASTIVARESGRHDPGFVVIDEVAGQWVALIGSHANWQLSIPMVTPEGLGLRKGLPSLRMLIYAVQTPL